MTTTESIAGIDVYLSRTPGIGGVVRSDASDFRVTEVWAPEKSRNTENGKYLIVKLTKKNWDTHHLIRDLSRWFRVSRSRFGWAGTKDTRAVTTQRIGIWDPDRAIEAKIPNFRIPNVTLEIIGRSNRKISLGDLCGNRFRIAIRGIDKTEEEVRDRINGVTSELSHAGGMPNFYGMQRFGTTRPTTHEVGRLIVAGDFKGAMMTYLAKPFPDDRSYEIRKRLWDTYDFKAALVEFPDHLRYERAMLNHLVKQPDDYIGAFRVLPIVGDVVCFRGGDGLPDASRTQEVTQVDIDGINNLIRKKRAWVTHSLIGYGYEPGNGIEGAVVSDLGIDLPLLTRGFEVAEMPELASKGGCRAVAIGVDPAFDVSADDGVSVTAEFFLPKGCYATVLLREYMKE
jgi:tRNA pseudouridine13 synthase